MPAALCLILETSTRRGSAVLADDATGALVDARVFESDRQHNAQLFGPLQELLANEVAGRVVRILVGAGPGSYSGTRVGIAAAQGMALAIGCPAIAMPSLLGIAGLDDVPALVLGDARRGHWWWARLDGRRMVTPAPELGDAEGLMQTVRAAQQESRRLFTFEDATAFDWLGEPVMQVTPDATGLWRAWCDATPHVRAAWEREPAQPCYLKPPHITAPKRAWLQA